MIADGYHDVVPGKLVSAVTYLEMRARCAPSFEPREDARIVRSHPTIERYRATFRRVGAPYLWSSRLAMPDDELAALLADPNVETFDLERCGSFAGFLELDFRASGCCELAFFAIVRSEQRRGLGTQLMRFALDRAWRRPIDRVWLHTCTLDDPAAIPFYRRNGFMPYKRQFEVIDDPRVSGLLPLDCAPDVPVL